MKKVTHTDGRGRKYIVLADEGDDDLSICPVVGPPDVVDSLDLPEPFATDLHNELFKRSIFAPGDANIKSLTGALQAAIKINVQKLHTAFVQFDKEPDEII